MIGRPIDQMSHAIAGPRAVFFSALFLVATSAFLAVGPALAHHSSSPFDNSRSVVLEGTVLAVEWTNPHVWIRLEVVDEAGNVVKWGVETSNPLDLGRRGWTRNTFRAGDKVAITVNPARNGSPNGAFIQAILADGSVVSEGALIDAAERNAE